MSDMNSMISESSHTFANSSEFNFISYRNVENCTNHCLAFHEGLVMNAELICSDLNAVLDQVDIIC